MLMDDSSGGFDYMDEDRDRAMDRSMERADRTAAGRPKR